MLLSIFSNESSTARGRDCDVLVNGVYDSVSSGEKEEMVSLRRTSITN